MGERDTALAALLFEMQGNIRADIRECKTDLSSQITDVREKQDDHDVRLTILERQTSGLGLTKTQKTALWTGMSGLALEGLRHLKTLLFTLVCLVKGAPRL